MKKSEIHMTLKEFEYLSKILELKQNILHKIEVYNTDPERISISPFEEYSLDALEIMRSANELNIHLGRYHCVRKAVQSFEDLPMSTARMLYDAYVERRKRLQDSTNIDEENRRRLRKLAQTAIEQMQFEILISLLRGADHEYFDKEITILEKLNR